jgi:3-hydroxyacyl-CoA dehydrogenase/3a,7a,12a-trihydroxy-5b-cholest-24-enoyl-CoA hydratase
MPITKAQADQLVGHEFPMLTFSYTERDAVLYALGIGAPLDWIDQEELQFVYELSTRGFKALPTFAVLYPSKMIDVLVGGRIGDFEFNPMMLVHGEQFLHIVRPLQPRDTIHCHPRITQIYDKGSGMVIVTETLCRDEQGEVMVVNESSMFIRGEGGFGGDRGPSGEVNVPPDRQPDAVVEQKTLPQQALLYRLSGDINPLHADPMMAALGGFDRPILHGLCTFGFAGRAVLKHFCGNDPARFKSIKVRFARHVFPSETLVTEMWRESEQRIVFRCKVAERNETVLTQAAVELNP